jgi:MFS family permease
MDDPAIGPVSGTEQAAGDEKKTLRRAALIFVVLFGVISLFADMTYEGARSISGPFLATLGASGTIVGIVAGFGELMGYGLRLVSGRLSDRTGRYWPIALFGYFLQLPAVPLVAIAGSWPVAAVFLVAERTGKAIRNPARDTMISHASEQVGQGWGFGLHEAFDSTGAMLGPLLVALAVTVSGGYRAGFVILAIPAALALLTLLRARAIYPDPRVLSSDRGELPPSSLPRAFWLYLAAGAFIAMGYADYPLIAFRFQRHGTIDSSLIPIYYAAAMGAAAAGALIVGRLFDLFGLRAIGFAIAAAALFAPLVFYGNAVLAFIGVLLWGLGLSVQDATIRAAIAPLVSRDKRGTAYGLFDTSFGVFWFIGSVLLGILYDTFLPALVGFSIAAQLLALPLLVATRRR